MLARNPETNRIVLHGHLAEKFGGPFDLGVNSPAEAVQALCLMKHGFKEALCVGSYRVLYGKEEDDFPLEVDQLRLGLGQGNEMHIVPAAAGAGRNGMGIAKVILGIALVGFAFFFPGAFPISLPGGIQITSSSVALFGVSMILQGISAIFAPNPNNQKKKKEESFLISGAVNSIGQGAPIPLCYGGPVRAGSQVISLSYTVADIPLNFKLKKSDGQTGEYDPNTPVTSDQTATGSTDTVGGEYVGGGEWSGVENMSEGV